MNGNWKTIAAVVSLILVIVGFVLGSMSSQIDASERFVARQQYERDRSEINGKLDLLLEFHLEDKRAGR